MNQNEIRAKITDQIIEALTKGGLPPWRMPWRSDPNAGFPMNVVSKHKYQGINPLLLQLANMRHGFTSKWWATFKQWDELGAKVLRRPNDVKPGEWGTTIVFWKPLEIVEEGENGQELKKTIFILKTYVVFNADQVEGSNHLRCGSVPACDSVSYDEADRAIAATGAEIRHGGNQAFYSRKQDYIQVPCREQFSAPEYYETILHELTHWTEHPSRLDWHQADRPYAMGELIAEMGSCFLATELNIPNADTLPNHASYLQSWLREMKSDPKYIFEASKHASKSSDFILSFSRKEVLAEV